MLSILATTLVVFALFGCFIAWLASGFIETRNRDAEDCRTQGYEHMVNTRDGWFCVDKEGRLVIPTNRLKSTVR